MNFLSPWRSRIFVLLVAGVRRLLRPFGRAENAFIEQLVAVQNHFVYRHLRRHGAISVLLIMPRCVKESGCHCEVRASLAECSDCDRCQLGQIARLCDRYGIRALVAFRSHIAFALARSEQPDLIIATACHDRLIKAMRSVPEIPALLTPLSGMERPCINASCDLSWIEDQLRLAALPRRSLIRAAAG